MIARLRMPTGVSGITASSRRISSGPNPLGGDCSVLGRSSLSQGLALTIPMRMRNRKKELRQAMRAPMVIGEGALPETPGPWGPGEDLLGCHLIGR